MKTLKEYKWQIIGGLIAGLLFWPLVAIFMAAFG